LDVTTRGFGVIYKVDNSGQESVLYTFTGSAGGAIPYGAIVGDAAGNLYGTTSVGGVLNKGTVYEVDATGKQTVLHTFTGADGLDPVYGLIRDSAGNLYGTTVSGGPANQGVLFKLDTSGNYSVLHNFSGGADGAIPIGRLFRDGDGNIFGLSLGPGPNMCIFYELSASGNYTVRSSFGFGTLDSGVVGDGSGNFYGTAGNEHGTGTIYKIDPSGNQTTWAAIPGVPTGELYRDPAGNIYGVANNQNAELGLVYKADSTGHVTVRHAFQNDYPTGGVIEDSVGNLYGTTEYGPYGCGEVYKIGPDGHVTTLYSFAAPGQADGCDPTAGVIRDSSGNLYGTTSFGGLGGVGDVFKIKVQ
jgi:uncharacterized repeat protein (TIGR03803 family)